MSEHGLRSVTALLTLAAGLACAVTDARAQSARSGPVRGPVLLLPIETDGAPRVPVPPQRRGDSTYHRADLHSSPDPASSLPGGRSGTPSYNAEPRPLTQSIGGSVEAPDYWIVSTRRCSQEGRPHCPAGTYDYFHVGPGGRPQFLDEPSFQAWLTPGVPVCVVVHGSFTNWSDAVEGSARMSEWIRSAAPDRPLHVVFFTWPSEGDEWWLLPPVNVGVLGRRAEFNGFYLADLISRIPPAHPVSLFGHSHGARVVTSAVHLKAGGLIQGQRLSHAEALGRRYRVVLAAAAVDQHWLSPGGRYACAMARVERLVNLRNRNDIALAVYPLRRVLSGLPLGRSGFRPIDRAQFRRLGLAVAELDVTGLLDTGHLWDNYYRRPEIARSIAPYLYFTDAIGPAAAPAGPRTFEFETSPPASGPRLPQQGSSSPGPAIMVP